MVKKENMLHIHTYAMRIGKFNRNRKNTYESRSTVLRHSISIEFYFFDPSWHLQNKILSFQAKVLYLLHFVLKNKFFEKSQQQFSSRSFY